MSAESKGGAAVSALESLWLNPDRPPAVTAETARLALEAWKAESDRCRKAQLLAGSELDWLIGYLSETDAHAEEHARRARAALVHDSSQDRGPVEELGDIAAFAFADALLALEEEGHQDIADRLRARWPEVAADERRPS